MFPLVASLGPSFGLAVLFAAAGSEATEASASLGSRSHQISAPFRARRFLPPASLYRLARDEVGALPAIAVTSFLTRAAVHFGTARAGKPEHQGTWPETNWPKSRPSTARESDAMSDAWLVVTFAALALMIVVASACGSAWQRGEIKENGKPGGGHEKCNLSDLC
jgi:hypothetical protein